MAQTLRGALDRLPGVDLTCISAGPEDYRQYAAPCWARATNPWHAQFIARRKVRPVASQPFDLLLVTSWEYAVAFRHLARQLPAAVMLDSVPATINSQLRRRGLGGWRRWLSYHAHHRSFAMAAGAFDLFLPLGSDCAASLQRDYGVSPQRCFVTLAPQDLVSWAPSPRSYAPPLRLLFVGNDFARKGGDFLLHLYAERLTPACTLTIASNDPWLSGRQLPPGVEWLRGRNREQLLEVYRSSDVFVFPTRQDFVPQVLAEALAAGLPCLASDVGGIRDLVHEGQTGFLMPFDAPAERWAELLHRLANQPAELARLSASARQFAEQRLGSDRFERLIGDVIQRLRAHPKK
jgi:glycosyltransferase involved in cell wall biosynthesis